MSFRELKLTRVGIEHASAEQVLKGYNSVTTFSKAQQKAYAEKYLAEHPQLAEKHRSKSTEKYVVPKGYDERFDHFVKFFNSVREGKARVRRRHLRLPRRRPGAALQRKLPAEARDRLGSRRDEGRFIAATTAPFASATP